MDEYADATRPVLVLDRYRVAERLGEGGLGVVVKAVDLRLKRTVAIKMLKPALTADTAHLRAIEERFMHEAEAGSRMGSHPNLVIVYDSQSDADRTLYLILEYVSGGTLAERIRRGPVPLHDALRLTADVARGLHAAHDAGIVHRDIKPANIFIAGDGRAQVGDFGIAQIDTLSHRTHATTGHPGTPLYMSPEQAETRGYLRPASDQYSLGLVLFEMLTGRAYRRLGKAEVTAGLASLPPPVRALIERLTAEQPDARYSSMAVMAEAAEALRWSTQRGLDAGADVPGGALPLLREPPSLDSATRPSARTTGALETQDAPTPPSPSSPAGREQTPRVNLRPATPERSAGTLPARHHRRTVLIGMGGLLAAGGGFLAWRNAFDTGGVTPTATGGSSAFAILAVGTTNENREPRDARDSVTVFRRNEQVYGWINFGSARPEKDILDVAVIVNGVSRPQAVTLTKVNGFQVVPLGTFPPGMHEIIVSYQGTARKSAQFTITP